MRNELKKMGKVSVPNQGVAGGRPGDWKCEKAEYVFGAVLLGVYFFWLCGIEDIDV